MVQVAILFGGFSGERVISEKSAAVVQKFLAGSEYQTHLVDVDRGGWWCIKNGNRYPVSLSTFSVALPEGEVKFQVAFNAIHGTPGEDGKVQGYLDMMGIPYNNCGVLASALTFNKAACNRYLKAAGVKVATSVLVPLGEKPDEAAILARVGLPCFVKPCDGGSSLGVTKVKHAEDLGAAISKAQADGTDALIESFLNGVEVSCGCIAERGEPRALAVTEIVPANEFFDFESKYLSEKTQEITPARLSETDYDEVMRTTENVYRWLKCSGMIRVDFMVCANGVYVIEVNTTPGLSEASIIPRQAAFVGMELTDFFRLSIAEALNAARLK